MTDPQADWQTFFDCELQICFQQEPRRPIRQLIDDLHQQWERMPNQQSYIALLREVQESQHQVRRRRIRVQQMASSAYHARASVEYQVDPLARSANAEAQRNLEGAFRRLLDQLRILMVDLLNLMAEQNFEDDDGRMSGNGRSCRYIVRLFREVRCAVLDAQIEIVKLWEVQIK